MYHHNYNPIYKVIFCLLLSLALIFNKRVHLMSPGNSLCLFRDEIRFINLITYYCYYRRRKWVRRGYTGGFNILSSCRFGAAVFRYASCLFYNPDIEFFLARMFLNSFIINNLGCCELNNLSLI